MVFPGFNSPIDAPDFDYRVNPDNSFTILYRGEEVFTSRKYRLWVQADEGAKDYIKNELQQNNPLDSVTLDVHKAVASSNTKNRR